MTNKPAFLLLSAFISACSLSAQTNNQTSSPYSLFGLGRFNDANTGKTNALGKSGTALSSEKEINNLNPASFATIRKNSFLFDVGAKAEMNTFTNEINDTKVTTVSFSSLAFAFQLDSRSGIGLSLSPYSDVGYNLMGIENTVEGSTESYFSNIKGSGGLNEIKLNYGRSFSEKLRIGASLSYHFGKISEVEITKLNEDYLMMDDKNYYMGLKAAIGMQYDINKKITISSVIGLPTALNGTKDYRILKLVEDSESIVKEDSESIADFKLPLTLNIGIKAQLGKTLTLNADYTRLQWSATDMEDNIGQFTDQDVIAAGLEYTSERKNNLLQKITYRLGGNYDTGYLSIDGNKVSGFAVTSGLGIPLDYRTNTFINVSYSYGQRGQMSNSLIHENYHLFTLNLSLEDIWFVKRKYE